MLDRPNVFMAPDIAELLNEPGRLSVVVPPVVLVARLMDSRNRGSHWISSMALAVNRGSNKRFPELAKPRRRRVPFPDRCFRDPPSRRDDNRGGDPRLPASSLPAFAGDDDGGGNDSSNNGKCFDMTRLTFMASRFARAFDFTALRRGLRPLACVTLATGPHILSVRSRCWLTERKLANELAGLSATDTSADDRVGSNGCTCSITTYAASRAIHRWHDEQQARMQRSNSDTSTRPQRCGIDSGVG